MRVDEVVAQFNIKTKVLLFVVPFVAAISGVGLIGFYSSSLLQGRMDFSNDVLQSLSASRILTDR